LATQVDAQNLLVRIELEALISERDGMTALNMQRAAIGNSMAYGDADFFNNADAMRKLRADVKVDQ
jgi:hypothetical protein